MSALRKQMEADMGRSWVGVSHACCVCGCSCEARQALWEKPLNPTATCVIGRELRLNNPCLSGLIVMGVKTRALRRHSAPCQHQTVEIVGLRDDTCVTHFRAEADWQPEGAPRLEG